MARHTRRGRSSSESTEDTEVSEGTETEETETEPVEESPADRVKAIEERHGKDFQEVMADVHDHVFGKTTPDLLKKLKEAREKAEAEKQKQEEEKAAAEQPAEEETSGVS